MCQGACMTGGSVWQSGMHGRGHAWQLGMHGRGHAWHGACVAGGVHGGGHTWQGGMHDRKNSNCSWRYASYWNAFLFSNIFWATVLLNNWLVHSRQGWHLFLGNPRSATGLEGYQRCMPAFTKSISGDASAIKNCCIIGQLRLHAIRD